MSGLGGWGDPNDDYSVHDGGFRAASVIEALLDTPAGDYKGFQTVLEAIQVRTWI